VVEHEGNEGMKSSCLTARKSIPKRRGKEKGEGGKERPQECHRGRGEGEKGGGGGMGDGSSLGRKNKSKHKKKKNILSINL